MPDTKAPKILRNEIGATIDGLNKIVFDPAGLDAIAFLVPHRDISKRDLPGFIVSVDEIERLTGLDFNRLLDDWRMVMAS